MIMRGRSDVPTEHADHTEAEGADSLGAALRTSDLGRWQLTPLAPYRAEWLAGGVVGKL